MSPRVFGTLLVILSIAAIALVNFLNAHELDRLAYEWFHAPVPVRISLDGTGHRYENLERLTVSGWYAGDVDPETIRIRQNNGSTIAVAFIARTDLARIRARPDAKLTVSSPNQFDALVTFP